MSISKEVKMVTLATIRKMKQANEKISMLTAYDYTMAQMVDAGKVDMILVGDSASNVMAGHETTLPITLEQMIYHAQSVVRGVKRALVVVDLPFGYYQSNPQLALESAVKIMKKTGAQAIKMEGGAEIAESISKIVKAGIPVVGHLGLIPQSINKFGSYTVRAKEQEEADQLIKDAQILEEIGCSAIVLEKIPSDLAKKVTSLLEIPTIGIGAGADCDGQVLVLHDMLGMTHEFKPKFLRQYLQLHEKIVGAVAQYVDDVKSLNFPNENESY